VSIAGSFKALVVADPAIYPNYMFDLLDGSDISVGGVEPHSRVALSLQEHAPDLIVIHTGTEESPCFELCRSLKANPQTVDLPVIAISHSATQRLSALDAGVDEFVTPQIKKEEFLIRAHALLRVSATRRQLAEMQLAAEVKLREQLRATFRRYVSPKLADQIMADPEFRQSMLAGANTRTRAAVMFADMRGFTGLSERLSPATVVQLLNEFFGLLTEITFAHGGTVFNMAGDCLMVGFGVPTEQSDGPERAIETAQEMLEKFAELADKWFARHQIETGLGIGINEGEVVAGNVGSAAYMNYTIIGDTVNIASRLGQRARAGEMLFSDAIKTSLDARGVEVPAVALPPLVLRGRTNPIGIFCVPTARRPEIHEP
jgi:class 3 adenylate cyclase